MMGVIKEENLVSTIKETIMKLHPISKPRIDENIQCTTQSSEMTIVLNCYQDDTNNCTQLFFMDGNVNYQKNTTDDYQMIGHVSNSSIINLLNLLLTEFPKIDDLTIESRSFSLKLVGPLEILNEEGIGCHSITLEFETYNHNLIGVLEGYFQFILENYYDEISQTSEFKNRYEKFCYGQQQKIMNSLSKDEMNKFLETLSIDTIRHLLTQIPSIEFMKLYDAYENKDRKEEDKPKCIMKMNHINE